MAFFGVQASTYTAVSCRSCATTKLPEQGGRIGGSETNHWCALGLLMVDGNRARPISDPVHGRMRIAACCTWADDLMGEQENSVSFGRDGGRNILAAHPGNNGQRQPVRLLRLSCGRGDPGLGW